MNWNLGYSAEYYATIVDRTTWRDLEVIPITGGTVSRSGDALVESADIETRTQLDTEEYVRVWMDTRQNGEAAHTAVFTGLASTPTKAVNGNVNTFTFACYSVLKPAQDMLLKRGWFAPEGMPCGDIVENLLSVLPAPVEVQSGSPKLKQSVIAENGETNLSMALKIIKAMNWRLRIEGDGTIRVTKKPTRAAAEFNPLDNDAIEPELTISNDWYACPNVFRAICGDETAEARDDDKHSPLSTVNRKREIWKEENCKLNDGESITAYAIRRLKEEQKCEFTVEYSRRYNPDLKPGDLVTLRYPKQGLTGDYIIKAQSIELGGCARTGETVERST